ncbi:DUF2806 domain-containing protein [Pseudomonas fluorescens]|uniref:DUF2806 domain-containing protein n=1 Tax=Pseudomonas fluorescens TaxID=294 RepID=UPI001904E3C0|nr:DUF2806 domain-containing protein [Pseudomonas fluorescens]MBD8091711.1 DUF2806 domain-containing protein [Pseudomonas fluorescens]MBD8716166.1 DUF2806 domain-containing protein [Pseudomonas fluorescens]
MTDRKEPTLSFDVTEFGGGVVDVISAAGDIVSDVVSGIPAPVKKSLIKALSQLCTAAVDVPIAHFEGLAAEKRAEYKSRVTLINESAKQISAQLNVDERFVHAASHKFAKKVVREQVNLNSVAAVAVAELKDGKHTISQDNPQAESVSEPPLIGDDWLNAFEQEAATKSSAEMQQLFGKILAGEIRKPCSFSIKTLRLISQLDSAAAQAFAKFCSIAVSKVVDGSTFDVRVVSPGVDRTMNPLREFGLPYSSLLLLQESGLLLTELESSMDYSSSILEAGKHSHPFRYLNKDNFFMLSGDTQYSGRLQLVGPALTTSGRELFSIVDLVPNHFYTSSLHGYLHIKGLRMMSMNS